MIETVLKSPFGLCLLMGLALLLQGHTCRASTTTPFPIRNQSPLIQIFGLPETEGAGLAAPEKLSTRLSLAVASNQTTTTRSGESILLDGETYRLNLALRYGVGKNFEVGADIPYIAHDGGFLDRFIINWHDTFGLPQVGRDKAPRNRLAYLYARNGELLVDLRDETQGLGDISLSAGMLLTEGRQGVPCSATLHLSLKLPSGDSDRLLGSGSTDLALSLSLARTGRIGLYGGAGLLLLTRGQVLPDLQRNLVGFGHLGIGWAPGSRIRLKAQLDGHSSFYSGSSLNELDSATLQLSLGGTLVLSDKTVLDLAVTEDIVVDTAPDVSFLLSLRRNF